MREIRYTLICDGSTDRALIPILTWLIHQHFQDYAVQARWLDVRELNVQPHSLHEKIRTGLELFPCELMFVHRDAERESVESRVEEINTGLRKLPEFQNLPTVFVIPVRMTEAWLLFDQQAIREASGNPYGDAPLEHVDLRRIEDIPDPKAILRSQLRSACGLKGRRLKQFNESRAMARVADLIDDFAFLRRLSAFQKLEDQLAQYVGKL